jgi:hypothetical protein
MTLNIKSICITLIITCVYSFPQSRGCSNVLSLFLQRWKDPPLATLPAQYPANTHPDEDSQPPKNTDFTIHRLYPRPNTDILSKFYTRAEETPQAAMGRSDHYRLRVRNDEDLVRALADNASTETRTSSLASNRTVNQRRKKVMSSVIEVTEPMSPGMLIEDNTRHTSKRGSEQNAVSMDFDRKDRPKSMEEVTVQTLGNKKRTAASI